MAILSACCPWCAGAVLAAAVKVVDAVGVLKHLVFGRDEAVVELAARVVEHVSDDARHVALQRHDDQVVHDLGVGGAVVAHLALVQALHGATRLRHRARLHDHLAAAAHRRGHSRHLLLDVAERGRELLERLLIRAAQARLQAVGVLEHRVEHALVLGRAALRFGVHHRVDHATRVLGARCHERVEHRLGVDLALERLSLGLPAHHLIVGVATSVERAREATQADLHGLERRQRREVPLLRYDLIG
jgi:hypothetical protein